MSAETDFERFFLAHYDQLVRSVAAITGDSEVATDSVQEAFIKAYARWSRLQRYEKPELWVRRVAINKSRDTFRASFRRRRREDRYEASPPPGRLETDEVDSGLDLVEALGTLTRQQRIVASLFYIEDISVRDIADTLELSEGAVKFHLNKARARLQQVLVPGEGVTNG
ncbi:MAG: RNA polymerase sigma factor [Ilumatobacteraceae bacterium]